jgi:hypothetical protein
MPAPLKRAAPKSSNRKLAWCHTQREEQLNHKLKTTTESKWWYL